MKTRKRPRETSREALKDRVQVWAKRLKVRPNRIRIQRMTRKWASCSTAGWISLAEDLVGESPRFQDYVIVHELLHLRLPNHGRLFKSLLSIYVPSSNRFECVHNGDLGRSVLKRTVIR
jgi:predicted metal-dependent hydrolase